MILNKELIEDIKTAEINRFRMVYRRPANDQHKYVCAYLSQPIQMKCGCHCFQLQSKQ